jgi:Fe-S cluster assembly ATPase SufC
MNGGLNALDVQAARVRAGLLDELEAREAERGVTPDAELAKLMSGLHREDDPSANVALTLQLLSLVHCADTIVGDGMIRGVSGGERKRVTSGEVMVGPSKVLFMDEISTGARQQADACCKLCAAPLSS